MAISGANFARGRDQHPGRGRVRGQRPHVPDPAPVLITVMGIEKLVPAWRDLEFFLQLLPRSSTGERMNPYTNVWTACTPATAPAEFRLVLLDNGRTATLADPQGRSACCIRCSACLNVSPGVRAHRRPPPTGRLQLTSGPSSPQLTGVADNASLPYASTLCGACYDVCPVAIDIPQMLVHLRSRVVETRREAARRPRPSRR